MPKNLYFTPREDKILRKLWSEDPDSVSAIEFHVDDSQVLLNMCVDKYIQKFSNNSNVVYTLTDAGREACLERFGLDDPLD